MLDNIDVYDLAVEYLTAHPEKITKAWLSGYSEPGYLEFRPGSQLFGAVDYDRYNNESCGCLTIVISNDVEGEKLDKRANVPMELLRAIRADKRIPSSDDIRPHNLHVFAEWQRRLDKELNREPPIWVEPKEYQVRKQQNG